MQKVQRFSRMFESTIHALCIKCQNRQHEALWDRLQSVFKDYFDNVFVYEGSSVYLKKYVKTKREKLWQKSFELLRYQYIAIFKVCPLICSLIRMTSICFSQSQGSVEEGVEVAAESLCTHQREGRLVSMLTRSQESLTARTSTDISVPHEEEMNTDEITHLAHTEDRRSPGVLLYLHISHLFFLVFPLHFYLKY